MKPGRSLLKGHAPIVKVEPVKKTESDGGGIDISPKDVRSIIGNPERFKYEAAWKHDDYRKYSPGEQMVPLFMQTAMPARNSKVIDWGAGTGRAGHKMWQMGLDVTLVDFVEHCLDKRVEDDLCDSLQFVKHDLTEPSGLRGDYGYCCDVLEHVPESEIDQVLDHMFESCCSTFLQISTVEDHFSTELEGVDCLHVTVKPYSWWLKKFAEKEVIVHTSNEFTNHVCFFVSSHRNFWWRRCAVNTDQDTIHAQIRENAKWDVEQLTPHEAQDIEIMFLAGGPSLNDFTDDIIEKHKAGMPVITVNGAYNWAQEHGIHNVNQFMIDAREFNKRFIEPPRDDCKYFIASQCHPSVFEALQDQKVYMFHASLEDDDIEVINEVFGEIYKKWFPIPGGCSVTLRSLCALQMMGFRKVHLYGFDSCMIGEQHHAYEQNENDDTPSVTVRVGRGTRHDKEFQCADWMAVQAREFLKLVPIYFSDLDLQVYGDGLIAYLVKTGADLR